MGVLGCRARTYVHTHRPVRHTVHAPTHTHTNTRVSIVNVGHIVGWDECTLQSEGVAARGIVVIPEG